MTVELKNGQISLEYIKYGLCSTIPVTTSMLKPVWQFYFYVAIIATSMSPYSGIGCTEMNSYIGYKSGKRVALPNLLSEFETSSTIDF